MTVSEEHEFFMSEAVKEAQIGIRARHGGPFGCVVVKNGQIVGRGHNQVIGNQDATCHGEMQAIRDASKNLKTFDLSGCVLYTTAEPCPMCLGAILWSNIAEVYYGCDVKDTENIGAVSWAESSASVCLTNILKIRPGQRTDSSWFIG